MCRLRLYRGFSTLLTCRPIVDRVPYFLKGGDWINKCTISNITGLRPLSSWPCRGNVFTFKCLLPFQPTKNTIPFSTSKTLAKADALSSSDVKKAIDHLTDQFMEARELLEDARDSVDTVYFSEDMEEASDAVTNTLHEYQELLKKLSDEQRQDVLRTIGLKMEELKAQQQALTEES